MALFKPLEIHDENGKPTGLWHYTRTDGGGTFAIGHCTPWETCPECKGNAGRFANVTCAKCDNRGIIRKENPCPGHATPDEAVAHYREYLLDKARYDGHTPDEQRKCEVCGVWTQGAAIVGDYSHPLCDEHRNREGLEKVCGKYCEPLRPIAGGTP